MAWRTPRMTALSRLLSDAVQHRPGALCHNRSFALHARKLSKMLKAAIRVISVWSASPANDVRCWELTLRNRVKLIRGFGTKATSRAMKSNPLVLTCTACHVDEKGMQPMFSRSAQKSFFAYYSVFLTMSIAFPV